MKKVILGRDKIAYLREGKKDKPKLLMLHGLFTNGAYFKETMEYLKSDFDILAPDFPGFGLSDRLKGKPHTLKTYTDVIMRLCEYLNFIPFHLVGASLGGMVGIILASKHPDYVKKIVIQAAPWNRTCIRLGFSQKALDKASLNGNVVKLAEGVKGKVRKGMMTRLLPVLSKQLSSFEKSYGKVYYSFKTMDLKATAEIWSNIKKADLSKEARLVKNLTLIIAGDKDDTVLPFREQLLSKIIKGSKFRLIKGGTHRLFWDCPEKLAVIIKKFLND
jgi:pimeloyl-ACP methyl ester carboxylesterase